MHILYIHQYFATPHGSTGTRSYEFARRWVRSGSRVTVLTTTAQLVQADFGGQPKEFVNRIKIDGVDVLALDIPYRQAMGFLARVSAFLAFMVVACWYSVRLRKVDLVYASSTPLTVGIPALVARRLAGRPYVFEVRDPWPEVPVAMGIIKNRSIIYLLEKLKRAIFRRAESVVTLSPGMESLVRRSAPRGKRVVTVPNAADTEFFRLDIDGSSVRRDFGWGGRFVCLHTGAMGRVNGLDLIVRAATHFRQDHNFLFVLIGEGREKANLKAEVRRLGLSNVQIVDGVPKERLPAILAAADLCLMTIMPLPILQHNSANKFFDYLSAGRPILLNYSGWQRELIETAKCGFGCRLGDETEFFTKLEGLRADPARCLDMPRHARRLAVERFGRDLLAHAVLEELLRASHGRV